MTDFTKLKDSQVAATAGTTPRSQQQKNSDLVSCIDYGAATTKTAAQNATAINAAIAATTVGFVLVPPGISYTEAALVMVDGVSVLVFSANGIVTILSKDQGTILPITKGGLAIKSQNHTGILLRAHDAGVAAEPYVQILDLETGDLAAVIARTVIIDADSGILHLFRDASMNQRWALEHQNLGAGSTQDLVIYADQNDDGIIESVVAYFIRKGVDAGAFCLNKFMEVPEISDPNAPVANKARLYCRDNGAGKSQLVVRFPTGAIQVIATEP